MAELREALAIGRRDHQPSDLHQAEQVYRQAVRADPDNADALSRLGAACLMLGQFSEAATNFQKALRLRPHQAEGRGNPVSVYHSCQGKSGVNSSFWKSGVGKSGVSSSFLPAGEIRCQFIIRGNPVSVHHSCRGGNPVSVHHSCPKR